MGNVPYCNCLNTKTAKGPDIDLLNFSEETKTINDNKFLGFKFIEELPGCICAKNPELSEREVVLKPRGSFYTYSELEKKGNEMIMKLLLEGQTEPKFDEVRLSVNRAIEEQEELDEQSYGHEIEISIKPEPVLNSETTVAPEKYSFVERVPYQVISKEISHHYSIGELLSRSILQDVDMTVLLKGVHFPMTEYFRLQDHSIYRGELNISYMPHGRGFLFLPNKSIYFGYFWKGAPKGQGKFLNPEKILTEGEFLTVNSGPTSFEGQSFVLHGYGTESWPDGTTYIGYFHMGVKQGKGRLNLKGSLYEGEFFNGLFNGKGKITYPNGDVFEGMWVDGLKHGCGEFRSKNGKIYKGIYENDEKTGEGTMTWPDRRRYQGEWANGKRHGIGLYTFYDKNKGKMRTGRSEWVDGQRVRWMSPAE
jgi:hypothetical protein